MLLLVDNFDSFTYNIAQGFERLGKRVQIIRPSAIFSMPQGVDRIVIGPGPGHPKDAQFSLQVIKETLGKIPILGICLGHQCLAHYFGAEVTFAKKPMHGKPSIIKHDQLGLFQNIPSPHSVIRYHSLSVNPATLPSTIKVTARTECDEIMGLRHQDGLFESVQYHPDSVMTEFSEIFFSNFINRGFS